MNWINKITMNIVVQMVIITLFIAGCTNKKRDIYTQKPQYITSASSKDSVFYTNYDEALSLWPIDFVEYYVPTSSGIAHIIVSGPRNGEALVLLHGMNATSTMWYPNIKEFSKRHRVYAIDLIVEPGKSKLEKENLSVDEIVDWYYEIFDFLELKEIKIVAASRGGWLAMNIAIHNKIDIKSLVLLSPAQTFTWIRPGTVVMNNLLNHFLPQKDKNNRRDKALEGLSRNFGRIDKKYLKLYHLAAERSTMGSSLIEMQPYNKTELKVLNIPILLLIGQHDVINSKKSLQIAEKFIKNVETSIIRDAGHFLSIDQSEQVNLATLNFLNKH